ncbi:MAG TPA: tRNA (adenosine(37)-N6)-threonylcarbamoyltransferase complex dimerization subunit type 1 TsaB [Stellaceae bacterium]|nr:tRNA (adenosine(37)-N6)-threonylcarbamoyltransferase complex dimerization subunit type 1 TsaB [Stellaceae bacterium]
MSENRSAGLRILAFDCSGSACSAAVMIDGRVAAERFQAMQRGQAEVLMPQIEAVMAQAQTGFDELDLIATTVGPGSFTGLRIGLSAARGLALATGRPIVALDAFEAVASGVAADRRGDLPLVVVLDSRRGPAFVQIFAPDGSRDGSPLMLDPAAFGAWLPAGPHVLAGDAAPAFGRVLGPTRPEIAVPAEPDLIEARHIAAFAAVLGMAGPGRLPATPLYLRAPDVTSPEVTPRGPSPVDKSPVGKRA